MFLPIYRINDRLLNNLIKIETGKTLLSNTNMSGVTRGKLEKRAKSMNLFYAAQLLDLSLSLKDVERIAEGRKGFTVEGSSMLLYNLRSVMEFTRSSIGESYVEIDLNLLLHVNKLLLADWSNQDVARIRSSIDKQDNQLERFIELRDLTVDPDNIAGELNELIDWFRTTNTRVNPLIRITVFLLRFLELAPFPSLNTLSALGLADFLLFKHGYTREAYISVAKALLHYNSELVEAWGLSKERNDYAEWIETMVRNLNNELDEVKQELGKFQEAEKQSQSQPFLDLNQRQLKILRYLQTIPTVKREDYCQMMDVSTMTAFRDLSDLVTKKLVKIDGQGRGTRYMLYSR